MSWDEVKKAGVSEDEVKAFLDAQKEANTNLAKNIAICFSTETGKSVIEHLVKHFIMDKVTPFNSPNIQYESGYHAGEAGVVHYLLKQIERGMKE